MFRQELLSCVSLNSSFAVHQSQIMKDTNLVKALDVRITRKLIKAFANHFFTLTTDDVFKKM